MSASSSGILPQAIVLSPLDGGPPLVRTLARRGVRCAVLEPPGQAWVARSRVADGHVLGNLPEETEGWLGALEQLADHHGDGVLIAGSDRAVELLVAERERIPERLWSFESPTSGHLELMDKRSLATLAERAGIRAPWTLPLSADDAGEVAERATYPCVIKPALSHLWRRTFGDRRVLYVREPGELEPLARPALEAGLELLVCEFIPGPERNLENAVLLRLDDGSYAIEYGLRRLRQYPPGFGASALTESADVPETVALAKALLDAAGFVGFASVQTKRDERDGAPVLIEANVRLPQHFGLGDACGVDSSWRLYASLAGVSLGPQPPQAFGVRSVVASNEPRAAWIHLREGGSLRSLLASYRGVRDVSGLSWRDPGPGLALGRRQLTAAARHRRTHGSAARLPRAILVSPGDGGIAVARSLRRHGVDVAILVPPGQAWVARTRAARGYVLASLPEDAAGWLARLEALAREGPGVLISGSDQATEFLCTHREQIPRTLRSFESATSSHLTLMNKATLYELAAEAAIRAPEAMSIRSLEEAEDLAGRVTYPRLLKPALSHRWRRAFGDVRVSRVDSAAELLSAAAPALEAGLELLLTEYVPGPDTGLENAVLVRRSDGSIALSYGVRKLRQYPAGSGGGSLHVSAPVPATIELAERLLDAAGFVGLAVTEAKRHAESGELVLIDVNVRLPQHFGLGDAAGVEASWRLYATLAELPLPPQRGAVDGLRSVVPSLEARAAWDHLHAGGSFASLLAGYRGVRDAGGLGLSDPLPIAGLAREYARALSRTRRRGR